MTNPSHQPDGPAADRLEPPDAAQQFGKAAADDAELADRLTREADGDLGRAESEFDDEKRGPVRTATAPPEKPE